MGDAWPWIAMALLGAYHGLNPAMGWLFAVGLGLQEGDRRAVLRALPPIAIGHELALAAVVVIVLVLGVVASSDVLHLIAAGHADRLRRVPLRATARAPALDARAGQPARADAVVVPDVERTRRRA